MITDSERGLELHVAAARGDLERVKSLHNSGTDLSYINPVNGATAAFFAAQNNQVTVLEYLIAHEADVNKKVFLDGNFISPLAKAIMNGHYKSAKLLLDKKAKASVQYLKSVITKEALSNMLIFAAEAGDLDIVEMFYKKFAINLNEKNQGVSAVHLAIQNGHFHIVYWLIDNGADINVLTDGSNWTPLHIAILNYYKQGFTDSMYALITKLKELGADVSIVDSQGRTFLQIAENLGIDAVLSLYPQNEDNNDSDLYSFHALIPESINFNAFRDMPQFPWNLDKEKELNQFDDHLKSISFMPNIFESTSSDSLSIIFIPKELFSFTIEQISNFIGKLSCFKEVGEDA